MKTSRIIIIYVIIVALIPLLSFSDFNTNSNKQRKAALKVLNSFTNYVPSGSISLDGCDLTIHSFYISTSEISNFEFKEFLYFLKASEEFELYNKYRPDSTQWVKQFETAYLDPLMNYYHSHPAYHNYPVVNVSKEAAQAYCDFLTTHYRGLSGNTLDITFRLPTKEEWIYAANGSGEVGLYSWKTNALINEDGSYNANFSTIGCENITRDADGNLVIDTNSHYDMMKDGFFNTAPIFSFNPNLHGLYNMNGNVSEMLLDEDAAIGGNWHSPGSDIKNTSLEKFNKPSPTVGFRVVAVIN